MKNFTLKKFKILNAGLFLGLGFLLFYMQLNYDNWFKGPEAFDFYKYYYAIYDPLFTGGKLLLIILGILLFFPTHIFRKWLFYIAPPVILLTFYLVQGISVYSGNLLNPTRGKMAENGMIVLAVVTTIFILTQLFLDWKRRVK